MDLKEEDGSTEGRECVCRRQHSVGRGHEARVGQLRNFRPRARLTDSSTSEGRRFCQPSAAATSTLAEDKD
jgi:hypothetical protein